MAGAGLVYGLSSQKGNVLATSKLGEKCDSDMGLDLLICSSWKRVSFRLYVLLRFLEKMWKKPSDLATCEAFSRLTFSCWLFHGMQFMKQAGFRGLVYVSN